MAIRRLTYRKPRQRILILMLAAVALTMVALSRCSRPRSIVPAFTKPGGDTLCVAVELSPVSYNVNRDAGDTGYYYDIIQAISRQQNRPVVIVPVTLQEGMDGLDRRLYDVLVADIPSTVAQKEHYLFTDAINVDRQVLVQRLGGDGSLRYTSLFDLGGCEVYVAHGSPLATRIRHLADEIGDTITVVEDPAYGQESLIMMVAAGELPNAVVNERQARELASELDSIDYSLALSLNQFQSWAINKRDTATLDTLNHYIRDFKTSPEAARIAAAYGY